MAYTEGIKRIRNLCREYGVAEPLIQVSERWFTVSFPRPATKTEAQAPDKASAQKAKTIEESAGEESRLETDAVPSLSQVILVFLK